jgi:N,N'-diacetylchitobiose transport system permease protein
MSSITQIAPTPVAPVVPRKIGRRRQVRKLGWNLLGLLVFAVMVFPVYWMVATAF